MSVSAQRTPDWPGPQALDAEMREILQAAGRIAVLGAKNSETSDAHRIPLFLGQAGYEVVGVNPALRPPCPFPIAGSLSEVEGAIDVVNVFRAPEHLPRHTREILALTHRPRAVWLQLGIVCGRSAARLREAGIRVVQDRCIMVEHRRLLGAD